MEQGHEDMCSFDDKEIRHKRTSVWKNNFEYGFCFIHLTQTSKKPQRTEENRENYSFGPQTQAKCQVSSMVKQGQPSPVVSLPFRLYWQLSDPAVWITIISHSPHCVPPVSQTYSQTKTPTCMLRKTRPQKYPHAPKKTNLTCSKKKKLLAWTFHFCRALSDPIHNHCLFISTILCPI